MNKFVQDLKINVHYKIWWVSAVSTLVLIVQLFGFDLTKLIGQDWKNILDIIFALLTALGVHTNLTDTPPDLNIEQPTNAVSVDTPVQ